MKVETYKIAGSKEKETGLLITENEDWILVKHIPVDYVVDGFKLYRKSAIKKRKSKSKENKITRVLTLKKIDTNIPEGFTFTSPIKTLQWCENKYGLFEFQDSDATLFYGKLNQSENSDFCIDTIDADGVIEKEYDYQFPEEEVEVITFETDYFESVRLLMNDQLKKQGQLIKVV
ncbi:hypothetical protein ABW636_12975 [Aquimarina sp. 2201CG1-2-11]|uniref:hypothetical protein n=1 Tax=Aquimarina discodermiae TaxID=3231043 RepID=UPI003461A5A9